MAFHPEFAPIIEALQPTDWMGDVKVTRAFMATAAADTTVFAANEPAWSLFLDLNSIDRATITEVPVQFDVTPLISKEVDGF